MDVTFRAKEGPSHLTVHQLSADGFEMELTLEVDHADFAGRSAAASFFRDDVVRFVENLGAFAPGHRGEARLESFDPPGQILRVWAVDRALHAALEVHLERNLRLGHTLYSNQIQIAFELDPSKWNSLLAALQALLDSPPAPVHVPQVHPKSSEERDAEFAPESETDLWARLRAHLAGEGCDHQHDRYYFRAQLWPPATETQLRRTEGRLGFSLPTELRRLYATVANGGNQFGPVFVLVGAEGGCPLYGYDPQGTVGALVSRSGWRLHPRIEEALLLHPGRQVVIDSPPERFLVVGYPGESSLQLDPFTGRLYLISPFADVPLEREEAVAAKDDDMPVQQLDALKLVAPSLGVWFERWLDEIHGVQGGLAPYPNRDGGMLTPEMVSTTDLSEPDEVWHGLYRFGPAWYRTPDDDTRLAAEPDEDWPLD